MLETFLIILHVVVSLFLIFVVLLQSGQAADLAGAFGGGGSQTALGMRSAATLLQKATTASAIIFMLTSLSLGIVGRRERSVLDSVDTPPVSAPAPEAAQPPAAGEQQGGQPQEGGAAGSEQGTGQQQESGGAQSSERQQGSGTEPGSAGPRQGRQ